MKKNIFLSLILLVLGLTHYGSVSPMIQTMDSVMHAADMHTIFLDSKNMIVMAAKPIADVLLNTLSTCTNAIVKLDNKLIIGSSLALGIGLYVNMKDLPKYSDYANRFACVIAGSSSYKQLLLDLFPINGMERNFNHAGKISLITIAGAAVGFYIAFKTHTEYVAYINRPAPKLPKR